jgi:tryptophanyl-tRNA synthetase
MATSPTPAGSRKRLLTGIQSSGTLHIGNYFGALKPFVDLYSDFESFLMVADYHALTSLRNPSELRQNIINVVKDYLAAGVDPSKATIFQQSRIQEHTELAWILDCVVPVAMLELGHAYKDKVAKGLEANAGLFTYPVLMAADIILYDTDVVPVGQDQKQHIEYAREAAMKFNFAFGGTFKEPKEVILDGVAVVPGTDGKKMSKSYGNTIPLFGTKDELAKAVMSIVTDSTGERPENVYAIHKLLPLSQSELDKIYTSPTMKGKYKLIKERLIEDLESFIAPMREKRRSITDGDVLAVLKEGSAKTRELANKKMQDVRAKIGVTL